jgi:sugar phosphate isomerase/epimerase
MQIGIFAKTFPGGDPSTVLRAAKAAGYATVQYNMACSGLASLPPAIPEHVGREVREAAERSEVTIAAVSATYNMIHPDPAVRKAGQASLRAIAGSARTMGTRLLTLCTGTRDPHDQWRWHAENSAPDAWRDLLTSMEIALEIAEELDVDLGVEPEAANVVDSALEARRLLDTLKSPRLKIVLDPANLIESEGADERRHIIAEAVDRLAGDIAIAHAKDRKVDGDFATAGAGGIDFPHFFRCLAECGFNGPIITHGLDVSEAVGVAHLLKDALRRAGVS